MGMWCRVWKQPVAMVVAGLAWGLAGADALSPLITMTIPQMMCVLTLAACSSAFLMMRCYQRPLGAAYDMGYEVGRRDALLEANRTTPRRLAALHRRQISERARIDA